MTFECLIYESQMFLLKIDRQLECRRYEVSMKTRIRFGIALLMAAVLFLLAGCSSTVQAGEGNIGDEKGFHQIDQEEAAAKGKVRTADTDEKGKLFYMGHASIRITTPEGKTIYIDPYAGQGYEPAADLILVTHGHYDHYNLDKVANRNPDCKIITWEDAFVNGLYQSFDCRFCSLEAVEAGNNKYHDLKDCVGFVITLTDGVSVYVTGDTSTTEQMSSLAEKELDYAFFCCDGIYNMDLKEAAKCAELVKAKHNIPYHMTAADGGILFDRSRAEQFDVENRMIIEAGQEITLE